ncbi:hypothetical protein EON79_14120 [bacterium]|nr:MAG: hypothetical protein EON79_14120 [bacterium]
MLPTFVSAITSRALPALFVLGSLTASAPTLLPLPPVPQSAETDLPTTGVLAWHSETIGGGGTTALHLYDFRTGRLVSSSNAFGFPNVTNAINPNISPDGTLLTFMGIRAGVTKKDEQGNTIVTDEWRYFVVPLAHLDAQHTVDITANGSDFNRVWQDPTFLSNDLIIGKEFTRNGAIRNIVVINTAGKVCARFRSNGGEELSKPILRRRFGKDAIVCWTDAGKASDLAWFYADVEEIRSRRLGVNPRTKTLTKVKGASRPDLADYYPSPDPTSPAKVLFARWDATLPGDPDKGYDQVATVDLETEESKTLRFSRTTVDNSDPAPGGSGQVFFSRNGGSTGYDLYYAPQNGGSGTAKPLLIPRYSKTRHELGVAYSSAARLPNPTP